MKTVWSENGLTQYNSRLAFRMKCESADRIELVALDFYNIYVNDKFLGFGPAKTSKGYARRDVYDLKEYKNFYITVEVCCHNIGAYSFASGNPLFGAELYLNDKVVYSTDDFECFNLDVAVRKVQKYSYQRGFSESYIMEKDPSFFRTGKLDYSKANTVEVKCPVILDRVVDYLEYNFAPTTKIESGYFDIDKNKEHWIEEYQMLHVPDRNHCYNREEISEFVSDTVSEFDYTQKAIDGNILSGKQYFTYDFNRIVTGQFELKVDVKEDAEIYLSWSEHLEKGEKSYDMDFSRNTCCDIIKWQLKKGEYTLSAFEPYDCKYARINLLSGVVEIKSFGMRLIENKNAQRVFFECENKNLEKIVHAANNTLAHNAVDIFMDCPGRERAGWLCDSYFMGQAEYTLYGHNKVEKAYLENFICLNEEMREGYPKGMVPMCFPSNVPSRKYIPNWTLWYILELKEYFKRTGDRDLINRSKSNVFEILDYLAQNENELGLLEDLKSWVFVEWSRANDFVDGINYPTNMLYAQAVKTAGELFDKQDYVKKGNKLIEVIREMSFNGEFFEDNAVRDEEGKIVRTGNTTETCQYYALFFEVASGIEFENFAQKMIDNFGRKRDFDKVYPLVYKSNAFIGNFIRLMYLLKVGEYKKVLDDCEDYFTYMAEQTGTLWEYDTVMNSMDHGFASYSAHLILECLKKTGIYGYKFLLRDTEGLYAIADEISFDSATMTKGGELSSTFKKKINDNYSYSLSVVGEVEFDDATRNEIDWPKYFRKLDDSVIRDGEKEVLVFDKENEVKERSAYVMIRDLKEGEYTLSVRSKISGLNQKFTLSAEIYYGAQKTRYYYENADKTVVIDLANSIDFQDYSIDFSIDKKVDFIVLKLSAIGFTGEAEVFAPVLKNKQNGKNLCPPYDNAPDELQNFNWIGEGFSLVERPKFSLFVNGEKVFEGRKTDSLHKLCGVEFEIPDRVLKISNNKIELKYDQNNVKNYTVKSFRLRTRPKGFELLGVKSVVQKDCEFGIFCKLDASKVVFAGSNYAEYLTTVKVNDEYGVIKMKATQIGVNIPLTFICNGIKKSITVGQIIDKKDEFIVSGTGDFIYVNQNMSEFSEYLSWFLTNGVGELLTFRCVYHWGRTSERSDEFWRVAVRLLNELGIYYSVMIDGRSLNGVNANPTKEMMQGKYFLGNQTHERDGAYIYWGQDISPTSEFYFHLLSRKMEQTGIYGKNSPIYDNSGKAYKYYSNSDNLNAQEAYDAFAKNIKLTRQDGATRHTGVTPLFHTFYEQGYDWLGYESLYGPHELLLSALRGTSKAYNKDIYGSHTALQWSTVPADDEKHFVRYRLSLYMSYMHGVSEINTEEGLWRIENLLVGYDRYSHACVRHRIEQSKFNKFIQTHTRRGKQKADIAMIIGRYDGNDCFGAPCVFGRANSKKDKPEQSWDVVKTFYPDNDLNAIYYYIVKGGENSLTEKDRQDIDSRVEEYRGIIDYKQVGFFTSTPYGAIDLIPWNAPNMKDYKFVFFAGWNTASDEQLRILLDYVANGGSLLIAKPHLYDTVCREDAISGKANVISSPLVSQILAFSNKVFFVDGGYPIDCYEKYVDILKKQAEKYSSKYISDVKNVSYTEYDLEDGTKVFYLLNINWWNSEPAKFVLNLKGARFDCEIEDNEYPCVLTVNNTIAATVDNPYIEVVSLTKKSIKLKGCGFTKIDVFYGGLGHRQLHANVNGETEIEF